MSHFLFCIKEYTIKQGNLLSSFFGDLNRPFYVDFIDDWRHLTTSETQFITTPLNDVLWRHLTASNTIYNTSFDVRYVGRLSVTCALDMEVVYYTFTVHIN